MENIRKIHEQIYKFLIAEHQKNPEFRFTTRITNRFGRLDGGYWFHGNGQYLTLSFWAGMDWKNKTPNIQFVATGEECFLGISTTDSAEKQAFIDKYICGAVEGIIGTVKYYKWIGEVERDEDYLTLLKKFIREDKPIIDGIIRENEAQLEEEENGLGFIDPALFRKWTSNVERYRTWQSKQRMTEAINQLLGEPNTITGVSIKAFPGISTLCELSDIPPGNRCTFITGENGVGKTSILKAIGAALLDDHARLGEEYYEVAIALSGSPAGKFFSNDPSRPSIDAEPEGYAAYGPYRISAGDRPHSGLKEGAITANGTKEGNASLYEAGTMLYDLNAGLSEWRQSLDEDTLKIRLETITSMIGDIIPGFKTINWGGKSTGEETFKEITYSMSYDPEEEAQEEDDMIQVRGLEAEPEEGDTYEVPFSKLATGAKSVLAMLSDMMVRLFRQQPYVEDIAKLKGIVLIDEIDIHLHPKFQKKLTRQLTSTFPQMQFIISTHSPIPLLGAPDDSVFFRIRRNRERAIYAERINNLDVKGLTPNALLTSPVFGMEHILHQDWQQSRTGRVRVEDDYDDIIAQDQRLSSLLKKYQIRKQAGNDQA